VSNPLKLPVEGDEKGSIRCIVETPRGSRAKFRYDPESKMFSLSKELVTGLSYPYDWGFICRRSAMTAIPSTSCCSTT
jgi:inorganic pyrophosphatase